MADVHVLAVAVDDGVADGVFSAESDRESVDVTLFDLTLEYEPVSVADCEGVYVTLAVTVFDTVRRADALRYDEVVIDGMLE